MDAEEGRGLGVREPTRDRLVRGQHELLDDAHALEALRGLDPDHLAPFVEHQPGLGHVEIERAALVTTLAHQTRDRRHVLQQADQARLPGADLGLAVEDPLHLGVRDQRGHADDAVEELRPGHAALRVEVEERRQRQTFLTRDSGCRCRSRGRAAASAPRRSGK